MLCISFCLLGSAKVELKYINDNEYCLRCLCCTFVLYYLQHHYNIYVTLFTL